MKNNVNHIQTIGLGGSCHWCTEGIFQSIVGVSHVKQGWIASSIPNQEFSEAIVLDFDLNVISLESIIAIHLHSHSCTSAHRFRNKYRSALYFLEENQKEVYQQVLDRQQVDFDKSIITQVLPFVSFKQNDEEYLNYYLKDTERPFCKNYITPKLKFLREKFAGDISLK